MSAAVIFALVTGRDVEGRTTFASSPPPAREGRMVQVFYHPDRPERVRVDTIMGRGGFAAIPVYFLGAVAIVVGVIGTQAS